MITSLEKKNQPYARINQTYATITLASALREMFGVQLYKNIERALLPRIFSILNLDWLQHARSVRGVYEDKIMYLRFNFDACPMHSPFGFVHLTHQNLSARPLFCPHSLAKVNTQLLIYVFGILLYISMCICV